MLSALGHCEDPACHDSSSCDSVRLFRCSIHCDRNLCLYHLNAHNVYYEEEKKQNDIVVNELENTLSLYQTIFDQQIRVYRELVRQASSILSRNTSALVPIDQIRPVLEKVQQAIALFQEEKIIIKCESTLDTSDIENEKNKILDSSADSGGQKFVVRVPRLDHNISNTHPDKENSKNDEAIRFNEEQQENRAPSPAYAPRRTMDLTKKKTPAVKRLHK